jgi:hypothetical protein
MESMGTLPVRILPQEARISRGVMLGFAANEFEVWFIGDRMHLFGETSQGIVAEW